MLYHSVIIRPGIGCRKYQHTRATKSRPITTKGTIYSGNPNPKRNYHANRTSIEYAPVKRSWIRIQQSTTRTTLLSRRTTFLSQSKDFISWTVTSKALLSYGPVLLHTPPLRILTCAANLQDVSSALSQTSQHLFTNGGWYLTLTLW